MRRSNIIKIGMSVIFLLAFIFTIPVSNLQQSSKTITYPAIQHIPVKVGSFGYDILISCDVYNNASLTSVMLWYREKGQWIYTGISMDYNFGNTYSAVIPAEKVSLNGIEYYIKVTDSLNRTKTAPDIPTYTDNPYQIVITHYLMDIPPIIIYIAMIVVVGLAALYTLNIIKLPKGKDKNE